MKSNVVIVKSGAISPFGNDAKNIINEVQSNKNQILTERFNKIKNFNFYGYGYKTKTYTDRSSQLCVHSISQLLKNSKFDPFDVGLITVSKYGCLESGMKYLNQLKTLKNTWFASPMQFTHSICNMPNSISCIEFGIKGITNHFFGNSESSLYAIWQAAVSLKDNITDEMIVCAFDSISDEHIRLIGIEEKSHEIVYSEAAVSLKLKLKENCNESDILCEIMGMGFSSDNNKTKSLQNAVLNSINDANIDKNDVNFFVSNAYLTNDFYKYERKAIEGILYDGIPVLMPKRYLGDSLSASLFMSLTVICNSIECKLPFRFINTLDSKGDNAIHAGDIAVLAGYNNTGYATSICIKIGGKNDY